MLRIAAALAAFTCSLAAGPALAENACEREMVGASAKYDVPLGVLYAVGLTETGRKDSLQPYAMNVEGKAFFGKSLADAIVHFQAAEAAGAKLIDIGCMQINHHYHSAEFASLDDMFDPSKNVNYAAQFLSQLKEREGSWTMAVARYHAGPNNNPAQKQYVCAVITNLVAVPLTMVFFCLTRLAYRPLADPKYEQNANEFFRRMATPVDFEKEVGGDNTATQARVLGAIACFYGAFITCLLLIPNPWLGRAGILGCALFLWAVGGFLLAYSRRASVAAALTVNRAPRAVPN